MRNIVAKLLSAYRVNYPKVLAYIWQQSEYRAGGTMRWWWRIRRFTAVSRRGEFVPTKHGTYILTLFYVLALTYFIVNALTIALILSTNWVRVMYAGVVVLLYPIAVVISTIPCIWILRLLLAPQRKRLAREARDILSSHQGLVVAVAGSYGKSTMKEMLGSILDNKLRVAVTAGNQNTYESIAKFVHGLSGEEELIIVEFGEGEPDDIRRMTELVQPDYAVITGMAPNHLDSYGSLDRLAEDIMSLVEYVGYERVFYNSESEELSSRLQGGVSYSQKGIKDWTTKNIEIAVDSTKFSLRHKTQSLELQVPLLGRHNIGPIVFCMYFATEMGLAPESLPEYVARLSVFEHRMQARDLGGYWMIDDTYNGNIEGMRAGLQYLKEVTVPGRKLYATPGLVEQGEMTEQVHRTLGGLIAEANPDQVYLMNNSTTETILASMKDSGYGRIITVIDDPLSFYTHLSDVLAVGDVIVCQNDWSDSYS